MIDFSRATSFRIAIFCALASVALLLAAMAVIRFSAAAIWGAELKEDLLQEQERLLDVHENSGAAGLQALIDAEAQPPGEEGFLYLLQDRQGKKLAGAIEPMPGRDGWARIVPAWIEEDEPFTAIGQTLPDGNFLVVAHDTHDIHELIDLVTEGTVWILALILPLSLAVSLAISALILRKLEAINEVAEEIRAGNIRKRVPTTGTGDEFDRLAGHLNAMLDSIEDLTEGLRQVSNEIAHQMRTPLSRIRGKLEGTRRDQLSPENLNEVIESISTELDSLLGAFSAMLRIAQLDAGASRQAFRSLDLSELLVGIVQDFGPIAEDVGITLRSRIAPNLRFFGDRRLIIQMVVNLIENAIAHSGASEISLSADRAEGSATVSVADKGLGIPAGERDHVFQRFYRLEARPGTVGFGLGLSLVASIAKMHGIGVTLIDNRPGLRVDLEFPMPAAAPRAEATGAIARTPISATPAPGGAE